MLSMKSFLVLIQKYNKDMYQEGRSLLAKKQPIMPLQTDLRPTFKISYQQLLAMDIEVYTNPQNEDYLSRQSHAFTQPFALTAFPRLVASWLPEEVAKAVHCRMRCYAPTSHRLLDL